MDHTAKTIHAELSRAEVYRVGVQEPKYPRNISVHLKTENLQMDFKILLDTHARIPRGKKQEIKNIIIERLSTYNSIMDLLIDLHSKQFLKGTLEDPFLKKNIKSVVITRVYDRKNAQSL